MPEEYDIFIANSTYPEAEVIFQSWMKSLNEIRDDCFVVLDTNALVVPYTISPKSLDKIRSVYQSLVKKKRLVIPGQVAREFAKQRPNKISELFQQLNRKANGLQPLQKGKYPLLENLPAYQEAIGIEAELDQSLQRYRKAVVEVLVHIREWTWNDPVSSLYAELFSKEVIVDLPIEKEQVKQELMRRQTHHIPPGYKDSGKEDDGIGDLLIWLTILNVGKTHKKSVIFVSGEEKADWWYKSEGQILYPRYELTDEFRRNSEGQSFHIISFSDLLDLYGVSEDVIREVRETEQQSRNILSQQEIRILELTQKGFTNEEIASRLELGFGTVRNYLSNIYSKLGARNRLEAIQKAIDNGFLNTVELDEEEITRIQQDINPWILGKYLGLSQRELEIIKLVHKGRQNQEIADELDIGNGTVRNYISSIYERLGVKNRTEAIQRAKEIGLLSDNENNDLISKGL
jgi:DNA-binding NarL/FixJ family response regulator/rRNA-processing protein FCF1